MADRYNSVSLMMLLGAFLLGTGVFGVHSSYQELDEVRVSMSATPRTSALGKVLAISEFRAKINLYALLTQSGLGLILLVGGKRYRDSASPND